MNSAPVGSWLSAPGSYRQQVRDLCASDPRLRQSDPKTQTHAVRRTFHSPRVAVFEPTTDGILGRPLYHDNAALLAQYLDARSPPTSPDSRTVYLLEGTSPEYTALFEYSFGMHPSFFAEHERIVVFSGHARNESDNFVLPSMALDREHQTLQYFELFVLPPGLRGTFTVCCARTGRHIGVTRTWKGFSEVGILRRKYSIWRRRRAGQGWDCIIITDPPLREVKVNEATVVPVSITLFQGGYLDIVPHASQSQTLAGPPRSSMFDDICFYLGNHAGLLERDDPGCMGVFLAKIIASNFLKQADYLHAIASSVAWRLSRKEQVPFTTATVEAQWSDTQSLERRMSEYCDQLEAAMVQLGISFVLPDTSKPRPWSHISTDFQFLHMRFKAIQGRVATINAAMTTAASIAGNRQAISVAKKTKTITVLVLQPRAIDAI